VLNALGNQPVALSMSRLAVLFFDAGNTNPLQHPAHRADIGSALVASAPHRSDPSWLVAPPVYLKARRINHAIAHTTGDQKAVQPDPSYPAS